MNEQVELTDGEPGGLAESLSVDKRHRIPVLLPPWATLEVFGAPGQPLGSSGLEIKGLYILKKDVEGLCIVTRRQECLRGDG